MSPVGQLGQHLREDPDVITQEQMNRRNTSSSLRFVTKKLILRLTVESIINQTVRPFEYVIVNDGSKDKTRNIIDEYAEQYPWIFAAFIARTWGFRKWGAGIIEAFYDGFHALTCQDWEFMCKLDGDLSFDPRIFRGNTREIQAAAQTWHRRRVSSITSKMDGRY